MTAVQEVATKCPGVPDRALKKAADLAEANVRVTWALDENGQKITQILFPDSGAVYEAASNTALVAELLDAIAALWDYVEEFEDKYGGL